MFENPWEEGPCWPEVKKEEDWLDRDDEEYHRRVDEEHGDTMKCATGHND